MNESLWFHAMEIGHALGTLKTPAHGMGSSVIREGFSTMQHCGQESTVTTTTTDNKRPEEAVTQTHRAAFSYSFFNKLNPGEKTEKTSFRNSVHNSSESHQSYGTIV